MDLRCAISDTQTGWKGVDETLALRTEKKVDSELQASPARAPTLARPRNNVSAAGPTLSQDKGAVTVSQFADDDDGGSGGIGSGGGGGSRSSE